jgi:integrase/recombinase XerC
MSSSSNLPVPLSVVGPERAPSFLDDLDIVDDFLGDQTTNTLRAYDGDLRDFARFVGVATPQAAVGILLSAGQGEANRIALRFKIDLVGRGLKANTVRRRLAALRSVVNLARRLGRIVWVLDCPGPRAEVFRDTRGPGPGWDLMRKVAAVEATKGTPVALRNRAMIRLCHDRALRVAELVSLDLEHLEPGPGEAAIWVLGKGRRDRERLTIPANTAAPVVAWTLARGPVPGPLFLRLDPAAKEPGRLTTRSAARIVGGLAVRAGIERSVSPHQLRHHAITEVLLRNGGNVFKAQRFSRHKDLNTLRYYIDAIEDYGGEMAELISDQD